MTLFDRYAQRLRTKSPVALATVIDGPNVGAKLLIEPDDFIGRRMGAQIGVAAFRKAETYFP